jgi:4-hydroxy-tetrahydrodipicolinate synthase
MAQLCKAALAGDVKTAMQIQLKLLPLHKHLFVEANPIPLKWAMSRLQLCGPTLRLPLTPLDRAHHAIVESALRDSGLL